MQRVRSQTGPRAPRVRPSTREDGITLLETAVATAILLGALLGLTSVIVSVTALEQDATRYAAALRLAVGRLEAVTTYDHGGDLQDLITYFSQPQKAVFTDDSELTVLGAIQTGQDAKVLLLAQGDKLPGGAASAQKVVDIIDSVFGSIPLGGGGSTGPFGFLEFETISPELIKVTVNIIWVGSSGTLQRLEIPTTIGLQGAGS